jgi:RNA polymerase sigma-70 factor (ECF subfamily)
MSVPGGHDPEPREAALVARARAGDRRAFGAIYQQHVDRVYSYVAFRVRDETMAEDITQDVFLQALRGIGDYHWRGSVAPWLLRIARNAIIDHWRRCGRRPEVVSSALHATNDDSRGDILERLVPAEAVDQLALVEERLDRERLLEATERLTQLQQHVLALRFAAGLSIEETAAAMGKTEGAVKNLQHHALKSLRRMIASEADDG